MPSTNGHGSKPERVALYLRVSSEEQRERETIQIQREFLVQYRELYGLEVAGIYQDDGVSGTVALHERPGGQRLLADATEGKFGAVLVYRLDRLGRSLLVILDAHDRLREAGVALRSATEPIDTSTPSGRLIFQMLASFAEYERASIRERTQAGQRRAYKYGRHGGVIPYGYDIAPDGAFVVVEEEAAVVRQIRARTNGESWADSSVRHVVNQRAYAGTHVVTLEGGEIIKRPVPAISPRPSRRRHSKRAPATCASRGKSRVASTCCALSSTARAARCPTWGQLFLFAHGQALFLPLMLAPQEEPRPAGRGAHVPAHKRRVARSARVGGRAHLRGESWGGAGACEGAGLE
jgi:DNA invertase Pin-like site-specific DNA recombinase